jgi:flavin-dependent dehydrogenase
VIGGGPAGATAAALLAERGRDVVLLERTHHPRFHIGESLLPASGPLFDRLGVRDAIERIGMPKWGVEFVSPDHAHRAYLEFADAWDKSMPYAWQVRRSEFDEILFRQAATRGARAHEGHRVHSVVFDDTGADVGALTDDGVERRYRARFVLDASGRDTLLARQFDLKVRNPEHNSSALFGHFRGARRLDGKREGNISIFWFRHGWFWFIPLADGVTSVGAVCWPHYLKARNKPLPAFFADTIAMAPALAERLDGATLIEDTVHATGNYSYSSRASGGDRYLLLGDAYAFIDPVFSSGVHLAMVSAFEAVPVVDAVLDRPAAAPAARRRYGRMMRKGPREFSWFILRMTNPAIRGLFMHPRNPLRVQEAVLSLLSGDIYGRTPIWPSLALFKVIYHVSAALTWRRSAAARRARAQLIADVGPVPGETLLERGGG